MFFREWAVRILMVCAFFTVCSGTDSHADELAQHIMVTYIGNSSFEDAMRTLRVLSGQALLSAEVYTDIVELLGYPRVGYLVEIRDGAERILTTNTQFNDQPKVQTALGWAAFRGDFDTSRRALSLLAGMPMISERAVGALILMLEYGKPGDSASIRAQAEILLRSEKAQMTPGNQMNLAIRGLTRTATEASRYLSILDSHARSLDRSIVPKLMDYATFDRPGGDPYAVRKQAAQLLRAIECNAMLKDSRPPDPRLKLPLKLVEPS